MRKTLFKRFNLRYMTTPDGDQGGAGAGNSGDGADNAGSTNTTDSKTSSSTKTDGDEDADGDGEKKYTQADVDRIVQTRLARDRKSSSNAGGSNGSQSESDVAKQIQTAVDTALAAAETKNHAALRLSEAKGIAATLGFADPALVTQLIGDLSDVPVTNGEVDTKALTAKVEAVLTKYPYLKGSTQTNQIPGVGVGGNSGTPSVEPGPARIKQAMKNATK